jgi:predicted transcriptional regulator YheO
MAHRLSRFRPIADAIVRLFHPYAEVVLHDIIDDTIEYIANPFSDRVTGDTSYLELDPKDPSLQKDVLGPYEKAGNNGQPIRSITAVLRSENGNPMGILCINLNLKRPATTASPFDPLPRFFEVKMVIRWVFFVLILIFRF